MNGTVQRVGKPENLLKLGWEEKYFPIHDYEWLSITEKPKELTDSVWAYVRPRLEAMIREHKKNILEAELRDRLGKRRQEAQPFYEELVRQIPVVHDGDSKLRPPIELACQLSPTLNRSLNEAGATIQVTKDRWDFIRETLVRDLEAYSLTLKRSMISLVPQMEIDALHSTSPDEFDILYQASFLVRCPMCAKLYGYPSVFDHPRCSRHAELHALQSYATMDPREQEIPEIVAYVLSALDLPKDTPYKTLESLGKRLRCLCGNPKVCAPMDFGTLVAHILEENRTHKKVVGRRGASPDAQAVTLCNDHDVVEGNLPLALLPVYILPHIEGAHHIPSNTPMYCRLCKVAAHRLVTLRSQPEIDYHMSAKHLRTVSSRDDVLTYQEFWPSRIY
ncbi:hypothetical protein PLICRDRAFT_510130 [Plicaturopsis crispa FD-325 SS-3]|nr:hypothetical protein PLICRDRAFT_510130 [Plicaturopsis crispa FD-325 SS-3]